MPQNHFANKLETNEEIAEIIEALCLRERVRICPFYWRMLALFVDFLLVGFLLSDILNLCDFLPTSSWITNPIYYGAFIFMSFMGLHSLYEMVFSFLLGASLGKVIFRIKILSLYLADVPSKGVLFKRLGLKHVLFLCPIIALFCVNVPYYRAWHEQKTKTLLALF
ncbi:RDD family protein [Helicobacter cetorum]|uniref:RDD family protein n=1 Tax=Helicobacter cetorum TaxID=138563 RepID=UPI0018F8600D|nr:RDD family protein [Helicobacter cetorum]